MRPKKDPQWHRHDEGNARGLKAQQEWKIAQMVRQRVTVLEQKVAALEERLDDAVKNVNENTVFLLSRLKVIRDALTPEVITPEEPAKQIVILTDDIKPRRPRKKK